LIVRAVLQVWLRRPHEAIETLEAMARCNVSVPLAFRAFDSLRALPGYADLERRNDALLARERAAASVETDVQSPADLRSDEAAPLMLMLHGDPRNLARSRGMWPPDPIVAQGVIVAYLQSSQLSSASRYVWSADLAVARSDVQEAFRAVAQRYPVDETRVILAGFSAGATVALDLIFGHEFPTVGFVCLSPGERPESFTRENVAAAAARGVRGVFLEGSDGWPDEEEQEMVQTMRDAGLPIELMLHEGAGHVAPPDFAERLGRAVGFVLEAPPG